MSSKLRVWRIERGLSQHELAAASGVSRYIIQLAESGIRLPQVDEIARLSEVLDVPASKLFVQSCRVPLPGEQDS